MAAGKGSQLGELLVEMGLVERDQLAIALQQQRATGLRLPRILADKKLVDEDRLAKAISAKLGLEAVNLTSLKIHERVLSIIPAAVALKYGALPIAIKRTNQAEFVYVVMADPLDAEALTELQRVSGRQIRVLVAAATELDRALELHYRSSAASLSATLIDQPIAAQASPYRPPQGQVLPLNAQIVQGQPLKGEMMRRPIPTPPMPAPPVPAQAAAAQSGSLPSIANARRSGSTPAQGVSLAVASSPSVNVPPSGQAAAQARAKPPTQPPPPVAPPITAPGFPAIAQGTPVAPPSSVSPPQGTPPYGSTRSQDQGTNKVPRPSAPPPAAKPSPPPPISGAARIGAPTALRPADLPSASSPMMLQATDAQSTEAILRGRPKLVPTGSAPSVPPTLPPFHRTTPIPTSKSETVRIPHSEEDRTKIDSDMSFGSLGAPNLAARDWDAAVRDWDRSGSQTSSSWLEPESQQASSGVLGSAAPQLSSPDEGIPEPVTSSASLSELASSANEASALAGEDLQIEILDATDGPDDIKTSQLDMGHEFHGLSLPVPVIAFTEKQIRATLEVPIEVADAPSPFEGPGIGEVPIGLERTGIIPALDWDADQFVPPPLESSSSASDAKAIAESGDIPVSLNAARARSQSEPDFTPGVATIEAKQDARYDFLAEDRLVIIEPEVQKKRRSDPPASRPDSPADVASDLDDLSSHAQRIEPDLLEPLDVGHETTAEADTTSLDLGADLPHEMHEPEIVVDHITTPPHATSVDKGSDEDTLGEQDNQRALDLIDSQDMMNQATLQPHEREDSDAGVPMISSPSVQDLTDESAPAAIDRASEVVPVKPPSDKNGTRLFDEADRQPHKRETEDDPTNPRIDKKVVHAALTQEHKAPAPFDQLLSQAADLAAQSPLPEERTPVRDDVDRGRLLSDLEGVVFGKKDEQVDPPKRTENADQREARRMVEALVAGDSLNSAERAELVLGIGRVLLKKGLIKPSDLIDELAK